MNVTSAKNPMWNSGRWGIHLTVKFEEMEEEVPFLATENDVTEHGVEIYSRALRGDFGSISPCSPPALPDTKVAKLIELESMRDAACYANITANGHVWQADKRSQELLSSAITLAQAGLPLPPVWRSADNVNVPVTSVADLLAIAGPIATRTLMAYNTSWELKAQVEAATAVDQVQAVQWPV